MNVHKYPKLYNVFEEYYQLNPKEINNIGTGDATQLMFATSSKALVLFLLSCDNGATINYQDHNGDIALHYAASNNHLESGKLLCECGAGVHIKNRYNRTPIDSAIYNYKIVQLLLEYDSNTTKEKYKDLVHNISLLNAKN